MQPVGFSRRQLAFGLAATVILAPRGKVRAEEVSEPDWEVLPHEGRPASAPPPAIAPATGPGALAAAPGTLRLKPPPAPETEVWCYGGAVPGPTLRAKQGGSLRLAFANKLAQPTTLHWHGVHLPNAMDGVGGLTQTAVAPGAVFDIAFPTPDAGTFWYRPLVPALAAEQTERGLYGLFIVDEATPPPFDHDVGLVLDDWALDPADQVRTSFGDAAEVGLGGRLGNWLTVNSKEPPQRLEVAPGARLRLRALNAANARPLTLRFEDLRVHVIAVDGRPSEVFQPARGAISLMPGTRLDLAVEAPGEPGRSGAVLVALGPGVPALVLTTTGAPSPLAGAPLSPLPRSRLPEAIALQAAARAELIIEGGLDPAALQSGAGPSLPDAARAWTVNKVAWPDAPKKPVLSVKAGRPVALALVNRTPFVQAMHVHGHHVRLLHNFDDGWEPYWLDTIPIPPRATARIAFVAETPGHWMIGSTILERLSGGLACWFEVT
ncbi:hypothetical protein GCM10010994_13660 [Chelatococcus reniformis]|uniref:Copper oxidase n=1 Tax=Chelatococcus reniformis TaxID=1494448 RepID=A0A916X912_9HYPH|nr:hypothetical protein GCM10010994_13660 [Chelatococcus reniformis]